MLSLRLLSLRPPGMPHAAVRSQTTSFLCPHQEGHRWHFQAWPSPAAPWLLSAVLWVWASSSGFLLCVDTSWCQPNAGHCVYWLLIVFPLLTFTCQFRSNALVSRQLQQHHPWCHTKHSARITSQHLIPKTPQGQCYSSCTIPILHIRKMRCRQV